MCKEEIAQLLDRHFADLREQYSKLIHSLVGVAKPAEEFILSKIEEYRQAMAELRSSPYKLSELEVGAR